MKRLIFMFILLFLLGAKLEAQDQPNIVRYSNSLAQDLIVAIEYHKASPFPGQLKTFMDLLVNDKYAIENFGSWSIPVIDSMVFEPPVKWQEVGTWGYVLNAYPFRNGVAARPKYLEYKIINVNKRSQKIQVTPGDPTRRNAPTREWLEAAFPENVLPPKDRVEQRRTERVKLDAKVQER